MAIRVPLLVPAAVALLLASSAAAERPLRWPFHGRLGVEVQPMTPELRAYFGAPGDRGVLVARVAEGRPAQRAGIEVGDVLVAAAGEPLARPIDLVVVVGRAPAQAELAIELVRRGERRTIEVVPEGGAIPDADLESWHGLDERPRRGPHAGVEEILRRLEAIERRLESLPLPEAAPPSGER